MRKGDEKGITLPSNLYERCYGGTLVCRSSATVAAAVSSGPLPAAALRVRRSLVRLPPPAAPNWPLSKLTRAGVRLCVPVRVLRGRCARPAEICAVHAPTTTGRWKARKNKKLVAANRALYETLRRRGMRVTFQHVEAHKGPSRASLPMTHSR